MDLSILKPSGDYKLELLNPATDEKTGITLFLQSQESDGSKAAIRKNSNKMARKRSTSKPAEMHENAANTRVASTITGWDFGGNEWDGTKNPKFTEKLALEIVTQLDWIYEAVEAVTSNRANFMQK